MTTQPVLIDRMLDLARQMQHRRVEAAGRRTTRRTGCGVENHDDLYRAGFIAGVCSSVALHTPGEIGLDFERRIAVEIGSPQAAAAKAVEEVAARC